MYQPWIQCQVKIISKSIKSCLKLEYLKPNAELLICVDLKIISYGINNFMTKDKGIILITHYQRLLDYINPTYVHVMQNGRIIKTGSSELAKELEDKGYQWLNTY